VEALKAEVAGGQLHPMEAKKRLARMIVSDFHGEAAALSADENWARMFQQKAESEDLEEIGVEFGMVAQVKEGNRPIAVDPDDGSLLVHPSECVLRVPKLLVALGLAASNAEASRKVSEKAVRIDGDLVESLVAQAPDLPARLVVRLGKRAKVAMIR
jgi:tyrosyl-tRNA synthetase